MYTFSNSFLANALKDPEWGSFIKPDVDLEALKDPNDKYKLARGSSYRPDLSPFIAESPEFHAITQRIEAASRDFTFEDQCSAKYYYDLF